jgi:hypothetical protein
MIEELQRRNFAESTIRSYVHGVEHFSQYFHRRPDRLGPEHIRQYQAMLFSKLKYSPNTVIQRLGALRFFYIKVLKKNWSVAETPEEGDPAAGDSESGGGISTHRRSRQHVSSRDVDDPLCDRSTPRRGGSFEGL